MPITTEARYFGEGIYQQGEEKPDAALRQHRHHVRVQRLNDLLGKEAKLEASALSQKFESIAASIEAADAQVKADNAAFIKKHNLTF